MTLLQRTVLFTIAGAFAGLLIWFSIDRTMLLFVLSAGLHHRADSVATGRIAGGFIGAVFGLFLGVSDALTLDCIAKRVETAVLFLFVGVLSGMAALSIHQIIPTAPVPVLAGKSTLHLIPQHDLATTMFQSVSPSLAWSVLGALLGMIPGAVRRSFRIAWQGAAGGVAGALFAAPMIEGVQIQPGASSISTSIAVRALAYGAAGGVLALGQAILPVILRRATLSIVDGAGKGREYLIGRRLTRLGSGSACDIVVSPDKNSSIVATIEDVGSELRQSSTRLNDGDILGVGEIKARISIPGDQPQQPEAHQIASVALTPAEVPPLVPIADQRGVFSSTELLPGIAARLVCIAGPVAGTEFKVPPGSSVTIGRGDDQDICLRDDVSASRAHAMIVLQEGRHMVMDNDSVNGTLLNGDPVTSRPRRLYPGDFIRIGETELVYEVDPPPAATVA